MEAKRELKKNSVRRKSQLRVLALSASATQGWLVFGHQRVRCAIGRSGLTAFKREGDGATPLGRFLLRHVYFRRDRIWPPKTRVPVTAINMQDGWCDAPGDRNYNRSIRHPYSGSAERLWREDPLYDVIGVLDYNIRPRIQGKGSAIFLHCASDDFKPTEGCVAVRRNDLLRLLSMCDGTVFIVTR